MAAILVTGAAGFIASNFVRHWWRQYPDDSIVILDALTYAGNLANLADAIDAKHVCFVRGDICDESLVVELLERHRVATIVHFAAESHVDRSIVAPDAFIRTNVNGTYSLLQSALKVWKANYEGRRFHHVSTDEVYGSLTLDGPPFTELSPYNPRSPYAASKAASDMLVRSYGHTYDLPVTISNSSNNYGPYQFPEKLVPLMILNALMGRALPVYGDGLHVRDWIHVEDHCVALAAVLKKGRLGETYNIGGRAEMQNIELVKMVCNLIDKRFRDDHHLAERFSACPSAAGATCQDLITYVKDRPGHDRRYAIDDEKVSRELGSQARRALAVGLADTVDWYIAHEDWWRPIQSGEYRQWITSHYGLPV
jgi:dTDP-glucose 4,6-dehydratase